MPSPAMEVARYLIQVARSGEEQELLSPLRLQKLLYYCQGWSWAIRGKSLFAEPIEAWTYGPVIPAVYHEFKQYGFRGIDPELTPPAKGLSEEEENFIVSVWETYKDYSATSLSAMSHTESPWINAFASSQRGGSSVIDDAAIKKFFKSLNPENGHGRPQKKK